MKYKVVEPNKLSVVHVVSEFFPYSKTGGLADAVAALIKSLAKQSINLSVFLPLFGKITPQLGNYSSLIRDLPIEIDNSESLTCSCVHKTLKVNGAYHINLYFVEHYNFFGRYTKNIYSQKNLSRRFYFFNLAALQLMKKLELNPDIIHCHDWMPALIPQIIKNNPKKYFVNDPKTLLTIHNLAFQGSAIVNGDRVNRKVTLKDNTQLPAFKDNNWNRVNFLERGIRYADSINTVSINYAKEILTKEYGENLEKILIKRKPIVGITNGIDHKSFDPENSHYLYHNFNSANEGLYKPKNKFKFLKKLQFSKDRLDKPLIVTAQRITDQKGFDLIVRIIPEILAKDINLVILGEGDKIYEKLLNNFLEIYPDRLRFLNFMNERTEHRLDAAADYILVPSRYEPCGTSHMKAMRYGVVPIARKVGGLADTIAEYDELKQSGTGFLFINLTKEDMLNSIDKALQIRKEKDNWNDLIKRNMSQSFTWEQPALQYLHLYEKMLKVKVEQINLE